jgi:hypothetical protein
MDAEDVTCGICGGFLWECTCATNPDYTPPPADEYAEADMATELSVPDDLPDDEEEG